MVFKKRKLAEEEEQDSTPTPKYTPGKHPRTQASLPRVDYDAPLDPDSELFTDDWSIPKLNLFISYTLDNLLDSHKNIFKDFIKLPSRKFHPQYYYKIEKPISINEIKSRNYEIPDGNRLFLLDVELITKNCVSYNEDDTLIVKNSEQAVDLIKAEVLKAKNARRNYLVNDELKIRIDKYFKILMECTDKDIEEAFGRNTKGVDNKMKICEPFVEMVDGEILPEYYEIIHRPISLDVVKTNLIGNQYRKVYDFVIDVQQVFLNALVFNDVNTLIYQDATKLLDYFSLLMNKKFFPELIDANERGELNLELEDNALEHLLQDVPEPSPAKFLENDDIPETDYNLEGLGNGYNRGIMSEDFLLGPLGNKDDINTKNEEDLEEEEAKKLKYNILQSINKVTFSEEHTMKKKPFELIEQVEIFSSAGQFKQSVDPLPGLAPPTTPHWVEYVFKGKNMSQNENMYTISLQPIHTRLTMVTEPTKPNLQFTLFVNKEMVKSRKVITDERKLLTLQMDEKPNLLGSDVKVKEEFDMKLVEGLNCLEVKCSDSTNNVDEVLKIWINIFA
ncbi:Chromatin structure-remodeling complex subunit RSC4 [Nakaseomyces bracarensis]|uniref:Chromatin structure-remodeling complex subunit RSC4 n=1 Tax=Nakaseomyces bracarensis TaxID=273131 RepID=A0ABR4NMC9_9SACH